MEILFISHNAELRGLSITEFVLPSPTRLLSKKILTGWLSKLIEFKSKISEFLIQYSEAPFVAIKFKAPISFKLLLNLKSTISNAHTKPSNKVSISFNEKGAFEISISFFILSAISGSINGLLNFFDDNSSISTP